jgi:hypothetical protein
VAELSLKTFRTDTVEPSHLVDARRSIVAWIGVALVNLLVTFQTGIARGTVAYVASQSVVSAECPLMTGVLPLAWNQVDVAHGTRIALSTYALSRNIAVATNLRASGGQLAQ